MFGVCHRSLPPSWLRLQCCFANDGCQQFNLWRVVSPMRLALVVSASAHAGKRQMLITNARLQPMMIVLPYRQA